MDNNTSNTRSGNENLFSLIKELFLEIIALVRQHYLLLKKEFKENAIRVVKVVVLMIAAFIIAYAGLIFLGILIIYLLSLIIPSWLALLLVTAIYLGIPIVMFVYAINLIARVLKEPGKVVEEFKKTGDDAEKWLKNMKK